MTTDGIIDFNELLKTVDTERMEEFKKVLNDLIWCERIIIALIKKHNAKELVLEKNDILKIESGDKLHRKIDIKGKIVLTVIK